MNKREIERKKRINMILETIKSNGDIDWDKFLFSIMYDFGVSRRTALEYIDVAKSQSFPRERVIKDLK